MKIINRKNFTLIFLLFSIILSCCDKKSGIAKYPKVDGSTANIPFMELLRSEYLNEDVRISKNATNVSTTDYAWRKLLNYECDLVIAYEPSNETKDLIKNSDKELLIKSIGVDALVFLVNKNNDINNLTTEDLQNIYQGEIKNWNQLGGQDSEILAFQRPLNSGSQTLFLNKVMKGKIPTKVEKEYMPYGMDDLIDVVSEYRNTNNAIGYSVYYYAKKMYKNDDIKIININGIEPNDDTIASGEYPYTNEFYVAIRSDEEDKSETRELFNYIISSKGKDILVKTGYVPSKSIKDVSW